MLFTLSNLIKRLIELDVIWGVRSKKLAGINDKNNYYTRSGITFDSSTNTITIPSVSSVPNWAVDGKYFRVYDGPVKTTTDSGAANYSTNVVLTPNNANNSGVLFRVLSTTINSGNLVVEVDPSAPGVGSIVDRIITTQATIDARIAIATNNPAINRINGEGSTVYNLQNQAGTGLPDGSGVAKIYADHYHAPSDGGSSTPVDQVPIKSDYIVTAPYKVRVVSQGGTEMTEHFQSVVIDAWGYVVTSEPPVASPLDPKGNKLYDPNGHYKTPDPIGVKPKSLKADQNMASHSNLSGISLHAPSRFICENQSGSTIPRLRCVSWNAGLGAYYPLITIANGTSDILRGVTEVDVVDGNVEFITTIGFIENVDTSAYPIGTLLYVKNDGSGELSTLPNGNPVAEVMKQDAVVGQIFVNVIHDASLTGESWLVNGNATNPSNFLGSTNADGLRFRTNNNQVATFDVNGRFGIGTPTPDAHVHVKSHTGPIGSGSRFETFSLQTSTSSFAPIYTIPVNDPEMIRIEVSLIGKDSSGQRCMLKRTAVVYRDASSVIRLGPVISDQTIVSATGNFFIDITTTVTTAFVRVRNLSGNPTDWTGHIIIDKLQKLLT